MMHCQMQRRARESASIQRRLQDSFPVSVVLILRVSVSLSDEVLYLRLPRGHTHNTHAHSPWLHGSTPSPHSRMDGDDDDIWGDDGGDVSDRAALEREWESRRQSHWNVRAVPSPSCVPLSSRLGSHSRRPAPLPTCRMMPQAGYRDGVEEGKEAALQAGFDGGFSEASPRASAELGVRRFTYPPRPLHHHASITPPRTLSMPGGATCRTFSPTCSSITRAPSRCAARGPCTA